MGLALVKRLVQMHGGEVLVSSAGEGRGSTFEIRLPRIAPPEGPVPEAAQRTVPRCRVLVVDDNEDAANSVALLLNLQGHQTEVSFSAEKALERIGSFQPDIALLDLGLPTIDGYELARLIRQMPGLASIRLVALSGYGQAEDRRRTQAAGFSDHLVKPVDLAVLERALTGAAGSP